MKILIALAMAASLTNARAVDLNTVVVPPPVTIASEVDRGMKSVPDELSLPVLAYSEAVSAVINRNKDINRDTAPFEFGLYYHAWHRLWAALSLGVYREKTARALVEVNSKLYFTLARAIQKNLSLTDENVKEMAGVYYMPDENMVFADVMKSQQFKGTFRDMGQIMHEDYERAHKAATGQANE